MLCNQGAVPTFNNDSVNLITTSCGLVLLSEGVKIFSLSVMFLQLRHSVTGVPPHSIGPHG